MIFTIRLAPVTGVLILVATSALLIRQSIADNKPVTSGLSQPLKGKKLIQIGQDAPDTAYFRKNIREMEKTGFDGIAIAPTIKLNGKTANMLWGGWFTPRKWEYANFQHVVDDMKAAKPQRFTDNFLFITRHTLSLKFDDGTTEELKQLDWFSDDFQNVVDNLGLAARIAKDAGFKGIALDLEQYGGGTYGTWRFPFNYGRTAAQFPDDMKGRSFEDCQRQVRLRGQQIMAAISKAYPDIQMLVLPSTYETAEMTYGYAQKENPTLKLDGLASSEYSLVPAFMDGLLEGAGPKVHFTEFNEESYGYTVDSQFKEERKVVKAATKRFSALPQALQNKMGTGFGIWIDHRGWNTEAPYYANHFTPGEFQHALHSALANSDTYAWIWCEQAVFWPFSGGSRNAAGTVPEAYKLAIAGSKKPQPLTFHRDNRGASLEPPVTSATLLPDYSDEKTFSPLEGEFEFVSDLPKKWQFLADDLDMGIGRYSRPDWDTSKWPIIEIGDYFETRGYIFNGMAWYKTEFEIPKALEGKPVFLNFGGIAGDSHIYVNGTWVPPYKAYPNGVKAWDITPKALYGQKNVVLVQVHNPAGPGGLFKSVKLAVKRSQ